MAKRLGRYEILEEIGQGGFAIVHRGRDTTLDRLVALKELRAILLNDTDWVKRFRREARTIARLDHAHIVTIHDIYDTDERLCIVMRLVDGPSLEELITTKGPLPWPETVEIITAVAKGLDYAHAQGILHRDLKPANILIDPERGPMLTDFGLAKLAGENTTSITAGGGVVGTPHYIAPEVWEGKGTTRQSDIYALGCILFEMLTGEKVFKGETPPAVMMAHFKPLDLPETWPKGVPIGVAQVLRQALANNPTDRYATAHEMAAALDALSGEATAQDANLPDSSQPITMVKPDPPHSEPQTPMPVETVPPVKPQPPPLQAPPTPTIPQEKMQTAEPPKTLPLQTDTAPQPAQQPHPHRGKRRGAGCWLSLAIVLGLFIMGIVAIGGFCSTFGQEFGASFFRPVELGETVEEDIVIPVPDSSQTPNLTIDFSGGELSIAPGADEVLLEGTAIYNVPQLKPTIDVDNDKIRLHLAEDIGLGGFATQGLKNTWDLKLGTVPMVLTINAGGAETEVELEKLSIQDLTVSQGAANFELSFSEPNQIRMGRFEFSGGASSATLSNLANTRARDIEFGAGAGDYTLDFSGDLQNDIDVILQGGLGNVTIIIPESTAAELSVSNGPMANVNASGAWQEMGDTYIVPGEGNKIFITAEIGFGNLQLRTQ